MRLLDLFISATLAQVTLITMAGLVVIWLGRRHPAFRHAAGVAGLLLVVGSPLVVLALPKPAWLRERQPSQESISASNVADQTAKFLPDPYEDRDLAEATDRALGRMPGSKPIPAPQRVPQVGESPEVDESQPESPPVADSPLIAGPAQPAAAPSIAPPSGERDAVPAQVAEAPVIRARERGFSLLFDALSALWCLGILATAALDWRRRRALRIIARTTCDVNLDRATRAAEDVRRALGLKELPQICVSGLVPLPIVLGVWKPAVILPSDILASASNGRLRDILIHECAHIVRHDCWVHLLQRISAIVFWFHPGVYWLNAQIGRARVELCDNFVLLAGDAAEYAETLLDLTESCAEKRLCLAALGLFSTRWTLEQRVAGLLDPGRDRKTRTWRGILVMIAILFASLSLLAGGVGLIAQQAAADAAADIPGGDKADAGAEPTKNIAGARAPSGRKVTIRGKCVDDDGTPVANATVRVLQDRFRIGTVSDAASDPVTIVAEVKTNASGEFVFSDIVAPRADPHPQRQRVLYIVATAAGRASAVAQTWALNYASDGLDAEGAVIMTKRGDSGRADEVIIGESEDAEERFIVSKDRQTVSGVVTDPAGRPVAGAQVFMGTGFGNRFPGMWSAVTDRAGKFTINDLERWKKTVVEEHDRDGATTITTTNTAAAFNSRIHVLHPQYAITTETVSQVPGTVDIRLKPAGTIEGKVVDQVTGKPAAAVEVFAQGIGRDEFAVARTDANGRYRFRLLKDHYSIWVEAEDRIAAVLKAVPATPDKPVANADIRLVRGGFVVGKVIDDATDQPLAGSKDKPFIVAHYGPACLRIQRMLWTVGVPSLSIGVQQTTRVNPDGTFRLRVAPGRNAVFFIEDFGETEQSPQFVTMADGEEKKVELRVQLTARDEPAAVEIGPTPKAVTPWSDAEIDADMERFLVIRRDVAIENEQALAIAGKSGQGPPLTKVPSRERRDSRVNRLLDKFERQSIGKDHFQDLWLRTIKEIVDLGPAAVPELIEELDATEDRWMLQLLGFALRAIDDRRAIPALIRAIPRTTPLPETRKKSFTAEEWQMYRHPPTVIMLNAVDPELREFAQTNQLSQIIQEGGHEYDADNRDEDRQGRYMYNSPAMEICGAITKLTGAHNGEEELLKMDRYSITSPDELQARQELFERVGHNWSRWWQQHQNDKFVAIPIRPREVDAIEALVRRGGQVTRDGTAPGRPVTRVGFLRDEEATLDDLKLLKSFPNLRELWMPLNVDPPPGGMQIIGELHSLTDLHLGSTNLVGRSIVGPGLKELRGLSRLQVLTVSNITNEDLQEIGQFKSLKKLHLLGASIDDAGMQALKGLDKLEEFDPGYRITDAGVAELADLASLKKLELSHSEITDASFTELKRLTNLESLDLSNAKIKGVGIGELKDLQRLTTLNLNGTRVGDAAAKEIAEIKSLAGLHLTNTKISDDALKHFEQLKNLRYLDVKETEVSSEATGALKKVLPYLDVSE